MNKKSLLVAPAIGGVILGVLIGAFVLPRHTVMAPEDSAGDPDKEILYWVAPMDPNYRRDKPGKSPMGMDLIPVYAGAGNEPSAGAGTITISPNVENNLGVRTATASNQSLHTTITTVGYVQYDQDKLVHIHPRIQGWVDKLYTRSSGDPIKKGQALYEIYSPQLVNAQEELLLAIQRSTSDQATLNSGNNRLIDAARDRLKALQLDDSFIALLMRNKKVQQTVTFYSPQDGVIDNLNIQEGFYVQPGTTMMSIGALDDVWVEAEIFERQASLIKVGLPVTMMLDYLPGRSWQGTIDYVYPTLDAKTRTLRLRLRFANNDGALKPNMFARLEIHSNREENLLVVPREAVIRTGNQDRVVLALGEGRFKSVAVELGRLDGNFAEILGGLVAGEKVVTSAQFLLDSESSKTSDFMRMAHSQNTGANTNEKPKSVWVAGSIVAAMPEQKSVTAAHEAIAEWDWPEMTMDFSVAEDVDFKQLSQGTVLHMEITELDNHQYQISAIHIMATGKSSAGNDNLEIDPQPTLNHSDKDHGQLEQNSGGDQ